MKIDNSDNISKKPGAVIWLSGLPCSGKTTIGIGLEAKLKNSGYPVRMLDGDITRKGICSDLGFSLQDRYENIRRIAEIARLFSETGVITICAFITPTEELRQLALHIVGEDNFINVFVDASLEVCEQRDVKGMYKKARKGEINDFTGVSAPFDTPENPDITLYTADFNPQQTVNELYYYLLPLIERHEKQI